MGFWKKIKTVLGIVRNVSPDLDKKLKQAEQLHEKVETAKEIAEQVEGLVAKVKSEVPQVLETLWRPGQRPAYGGEFVLFRGEQPVRDYEGDLAKHTCLAGKPLPPGFQPGDRWRQVKN